ncbi:MAG: PilZ domain-containing protein [Deltaproteobacteria bacterium]|nr:PilZ domain-containing protein [Deltaproteobacteria bacterium]
MREDTLDPRDRRTARRIPFTIAVGGDTGGRHILDYTADISLGGLYIRTSKLVAAPGAPIQITIRVPGMPKRVCLDAFVVRTDQGEDGGVAVRFAALPAEVDAALATLTGEELLTDELVDTDKVVLVEDDDVVQ